MRMFFGPGKRKGFSSFKVVDRSNKTRKSTVQLPSTLPLEKEQHRSVEDVEQGEEEEDPCALCDGDPPDSDDDVVPTSSTSSYKMRKERLHKNWESLRSTLLKFSNKYLEDKKYHQMKYCKLHNVMTMVSVQYCILQNRIQFLLQVLN